MAALGRMRNVIPRSVVRGLRNAYFTALDVRDGLFGHTPDLTPPRSLHHIGCGDFHAIGEEMVSHFRRICELQPTDSVLDIGCGTGRMAVALLGYLSQQGQYAGFDIAPAAIDWCTKNITARNPRFQFHFADIYNLEYNTIGKQPAAEYRFPCDDASIDFSFATSVYTHMRREEVRRYLCEAWRVLRPGGKVFFTFFVMNPATLAWVQRTPGAFRFDTRLDGCLTIDPQTPERAIAYEEDDLRKMFAEAGLNIREPIYFGQWSGRQDALTWQDVVIAERAR